MQRHRLPPLLDASALPRVLTRQQARALGWTDAAIAHLLRTGRWRRLLPRVYRTGDTVTWDDRVRAASLYVGPQGLVSGAAALADLGLASVRRPDSILVLVPSGVYPKSCDGVRVRVSERPMSRALRPGPRCVSVARAVSDLAVETRRLDDVRALVAEVVRRELCTVDELSVELRHCPRRGSAHLRQAVDEIGQGAWSAPEARAAALLRRARVPAFEQNARIDLPNGRHVVVDFYWRHLRAVLEIDSDTHHALAGDADRTTLRHVQLETIDHSVVHRTPSFVLRSPEVFVREIETWLAARSAALAGRPVR